MFIFSSLFSERRGAPFYLCLLLTGLLVFSVPATGAAQETVAPDDDPVALFNQGQDAHEKGDFKKAVELYRKALELAPEFPEAEYQLGSAYLAQGSSDEAEAAFRRALELRADWSLPMASLGAVLVEKNRFGEAEKTLSRAIELDAQNFPAFVALTDLRLRTKASAPVLRELLPRLETLTAKAKTPSSVWAARASVERALGDLPAARASLARAVAADPQNKTALAEKAEIELAGNDAAGALKTAQNLLDLSPNSASARFLLARALAASGDREESLKILDSIEKTSPEVAEFRAKIIANLTVNAADLERQLQQEPKNAAVLGRLCSLLRADDPAKALEYCRQASTLEPNNLDHAIGYGAALVQARQYEPAINLFQRLAGIAPDNYTIRANLAVALFQSKRYQEAKAQYLWLAEKQPALPVTYYFLGIIHDQLQEYMDAMANYQQFLRLADAERNKLEIEKVRLRLPSLQKQLPKSKQKR